MSADRLDPNDLLVQHQRDITRLPVFTPREERLAALKVQASRRRYHLAACRLEHVARTLTAAYERVRDGDLTLLPWGRMATSELVSPARYAALAGQSAERKRLLEGEKAASFRARLELNLPLARHLLARCHALFARGRAAELARVRAKVARLLYELGVKTAKIAGLVGQAARLPPGGQNETADSLRAAVALAVGRERRHTACKRAMAEGNLRLVWWVADGKYGQKGHALADLIGEGHVGLMRAVDKFDPGMNLKFSTMATYWVERAIKTFLGEQRNVRIPSHAREVAGHVHRARAELAGRSGADPSYEQVVAHIRETRGKRYTAAQAEAADRAMRPEAFLDTDPDGEDAAGQSLADGGVPVADAVEAALRSEGVHKALALLPYRLRELLYLRHGLGDGWKYRLEECGRIFGVTREAARLWEKKALDTLRTPAVVELLAGHV